jgi:hypothetical protein
MAIDPDVKALLENQHTQLTEALSTLGRDLKRSNDLCEKLSLECTDLRQQLADSRVEIENLRLAMEVGRVEASDEIAKNKQESADAIKAAVVASDARIDGLKIELDDLEQYGRRKSIRVQNVPVVNGEDKDRSQVKLLASINKTLSPSGISLRQKDIIRFHRSSAAKDDKDVAFQMVSQCIVKLKNWRLRQQFQGLNATMREQEKEEGGEGCRVYHDLTKRRLALLNKARDDLKALPGWFAYADINSNLKLRNGERFMKFNTEAELKAAITKIKTQ